MSKVKVTVVDKKGPCDCHFGHKLGDTIDFYADHICPMASHAIYPYIMAHEKGGELGLRTTGDYRVSCPDADVINVFRLEFDD